MGSEEFPFFSRFSLPFSWLFVFLRFSLFFQVFFFVFLRFSSSLRAQGETTAIYCKNGNFHSDPVCTDPVQSFSLLLCRYHFCVRGQALRKRPPPTGVKIAKIGKEGFRVNKLPLPNVPEMGALRQKIPVFFVEPCREMGIF